MVSISGSLINAESGRTNLPSDNPFSNSYDLGKELGANIFLLKFKQGQILYFLVRVLWLNDFLLGSR
jgi:hypothetical protein